VSQGKTWDGKRREFSLCFPLSSITGVEHIREDIAGQISRVEESDQNLTFGNIIMAA
jgi:hypothetical protein